MKIYKFLFIPALAFSALVINSCNEEKLELTNPNNLSPETYFTTDAQLESAVNAIYGSLQTTSLYNRHMWFGLDNMSHETSGNTQLEADKREYLDFSFSSTHGAIEGFWASCYRGINKANFVINNVERIALIPESVTPQARKDKFVGEAYFLRALYYFMLVNRYGGVPIYTEPVATNDGNPRAPIADVWALIEADCNEAATRLLAKADEEAGRATKGAAYALLGKALLYQEKYTEALAAFNQVTGYSLEPVFTNNFREETENGVESIFEVQFSFGAGNSARWNSDRSDAGLNESTFRAQEYGWNDWFNVYPSDNLTAEYETAADNGVKEDPRLRMTIYQNGDPYFGGTVAIPNDTTRYPTETEIVTRQGWNKYQTYYKEDHVVNQASGINMKIIRYADVLLMKAECEALRPGGSLATAIGYMNEVRARADVALPPYGPTGHATMQDNYPVTNTAEFMVALEHERKVELAGEQVRFDDLRRWDRLDAFIAQLIQDPDIDPAWDNNGDGSWLPIMEQAGLVYQSPRNHLWPIPNNEIIVNKNIETTDQNPGYAQ